MKEAEEGVWREGRRIYQNILKYWGMIEWKQGGSVNRVWRKDARGCKTLLHCIKADYIYC